MAKINIPVSLAVVAVLVTVAFVVTGVFWKGIWDVRVLDGAAIAASVLPLTLTPAFFLKFGRDKSRRVNVARCVQWFLVVASGVTLFVAYGSFRNQVRLASEADLNQEAVGLYEIEMSRPELRCLYDNYGNNYYVFCRNHILMDPPTWSLAMQYIEESWYILERAGRDTTKWNSGYSESLEYWRQDINKDPTGLFAYQLVSTSDTTEEVLEVIRAAGFNSDHQSINLDGICRRYRQVVAELKRINRWKDQRERSYCWKTK